MTTHQDGSFALVLTGASRSGLTALGGMLTALGVTQPASRELDDLNAELLAALTAGGSDLRPPASTLPAGAQHETLRKRALDTLAAGRDGGRPWLLRDARLLPQWRAWFDAAGVEARYLLLVRHPAEVVASQAAARGWAPDKALVLWLLSALESERETRAARRCVATYNGLLEDCAGTARRLMEELGLSVAAQMDFAALGRLIVPGLRHHRADAMQTVPAGDLYERWALPAYQALCALADGDASAPARLDAIHAAVHDGLSRLTPNMLDDERIDDFIVAILKAQSAGQRPRISIIIPCFNKVEYTLKCLTSIVESNLPDDPTFEVIVVDNASSDGTPELLNQLGGDVKVWRNEENIGFARANNQAALLATGEYLVLLNNDTEVRPGWLKALADELDAHPETGVVGARLLYPDGTIQHAGVAIGRDQIPFHIHRGLPPEHPLVMERRAYPIVTAACAAVRRAEFYAIGMFDEAFVNGHEDIDLCLRYRERGQAVIYRPDCLAVHHESVSEGRMTSRAQNLERTFLKWRYRLVQDDFAYTCTEAERERPEQPLHFAIKLGTPDRTQKHWGDIYYAECLAKALSRQGHHCVLHYLNEWGSDDLDIDVVIHLKGLSEYHPKPYNVNILWMLNHPDLHTREELERYDLVLVASKPHAERLAKELSVRVLPFLQATDPEQFCPQPQMRKEFDLVFVGNNTGAGREDMRRIVADLLPTRHKLGVWGDGWDNKLPPGVWQGRFVPWEKLPLVYASATIVLNDHQPEMRANGFVNNRSFDAAACGAVVVSDAVVGLKDVLPVHAYQNRAQLHRIVDDIIAHQDKHAAAAAQLRERVAAEYSFDRRAHELAALIDGLADARARAQARRAEARRLSAEQPEKVSVLMSTYNRREFLPAAIASVLAQTYANLELVLVNDGGVDVADIVAQQQDGRIKLVELDRRRGKPYAINRAYEQSSGSFVAHLDDDDIWYPDHLARLMLPLLTMPSVQLAYSDAYNVTQERDAAGGYVETERKLVHHQQVLFTDLLARNHIQGISVVHRRELFERAGWMDEHLKVLIDWDLWRRLAALAYPYHVSRITADHFLREEHGTDGAGHITHLIRHNPVRYAQMARRVMKKDPPCALTGDQATLLGELRQRTDYIFLKAVAAHYQAKGRLDRARRWYRIAIRTQPGELSAWRDLGALEKQAGNPAAALTCHWQAMELIHNVQDAFAMADAHLELARADRALACLGEFKPGWPYLKGEQMARLDALKRHALERLNRLSEADAAHWRSCAERQWAQRSKLHCLLHLTADELPQLADTIDTLAQQIYDNWHLSVIADFACPSPEFAALPVLDWLELPAGQDRTEALNRQIARLPADAVALIAPGDRLDPRLLHACVDHLHAHPEWQLIYTDEDTIGAGGECGDARYKPDFNLELLRSMPYLGGFCLVRRTALLDCGGFAALPGMEAHDLAFKLYEAGGASAIGHIPELLFHRAGRPPAPESAQREHAAARAALQAHLQRSGISAQIADGVLPGSFMVEYRYAQLPLVSIVIPTRDRLDLLQTCLNSVVEKTAYPNYEILIVDNQSREARTLDYLARLPAADPRIRVLSYPQAFNFAAINNLAARAARGDYLLLLNNDTVVVQANWIERMLAHALHSDVGAVGVRLVTPDQRIQHAGIVLGMGTPGVAEHVHVGLPMSAPGYAGRAQVAQELSAVSAACMLVRKRLFIELGGMDEQRFGTAYGDIDLCLRIREHGERIVWTPYVTLIHQGGATLNALPAPRPAPPVDAAFERWLPRLARDPAFNRNLSLHADTQWEPELETALPHDPPGARRPRILGIGMGSDGAWYYRGTAPLDALHEAGLARCAVVPKYKTYLRVPTVTELARSECDTLLAYNALHDQHLEALACYKRHAAAFLTFGLDDLAAELPQKNPFRKTVYKDIKKRIRTALSLCDRLVVTTEPLREAHRGMIDDIRVVPNYLESARWLGLQSRRGVGRKPRVGWAGALQHQGDLELIHEVVKATAQEIDWVFFGMCPPALRPYVAEFHAPVVFEEYPARLAALNLDLAVAPLEYNRFNEAKSNLRLLEYGVLGWPVVCTNIHPYQEAPVERVSNNTRAWLNAIRERIADPDAAAAEGARLRQWVLDRWLLEDHLDEWLGALSAPVTAAGLQACSR
ncbi:MAG: glycosyltransferase [Gammaproteobacteria bacterium]